MGLCDFIILNLCGRGRPGLVKLRVWQKVAHSARPASLWPALGYSFLTSRFFKKCSLKEMGTLELIRI